MADTLVLGTSTERCEGSTPFSGTVGMFVCVPGSRLYGSPSGTSSTYVAGITVLSAAFRDLSHRAQCHPPSRASLSNDRSCPN